MDHEMKEVEEHAFEERELVEGVSRIVGMEIPVIGLDSEASVERLMHALRERPASRRRRRLLLACSLSAATVIIGLLAILQFLHR